MTSERTVITDRLLAVKRASLDAAMGKGPGWAQKVVEGKAGVTLDDLPAFLAALGLKPVDAGAVYVDRNVVEAYETLVAAAARNLPALRGGG